MTFVVAAIFVQQGSIQMNKGVSVECQAILSMIVTAWQFFSITIDISSRCQGEYIRVGMITAAQKDDIPASHS